MGVSERWLTLCIVLGQVFPAPLHVLGIISLAQVNLPTAALVWLVVVSMLLKLDLAALGQVRAHWRGISVTAWVNWLVSPFSMALPKAIFIGITLRALLRQKARGRRAGD